MGLFDYDSSRFPATSFLPGAKSPGLRTGPFYKPVAESRELSAESPCIIY